jgi:hypothetical protein
MATGWPVQARVEFPLNETGRLAKEIKRLQAQIPPPDGADPITSLQKAYVALESRYQLRFAEWFSCRRLKRQS